MKMSRTTTRPTGEEKISSVFDIHKFPDLRRLSPLIYSYNIILVQ